MDARPLSQPWKRRCGPTGQECRQPRRNPSFLPASHEREGAYSSEHLCSVGARMEIVHQGWCPLRKVDNTLPASYTRRLYGNLPRNRAYLLTQLRTGHNWLSSYRKKVGYGDGDQCVCGAQETVTHMLVDCPNLKEPRRELRREFGDAFNSVPSLLGGSKQGERGNPDTVREPGRSMPCWTSLRRHKGSAVARHEGSLTMGPAIRPR
jgi:hypothetical protein